MPNAKETYGVKIPELRKLAKEIAKGNIKTGETYRDFLDHNTMQTFEEETMRAELLMAEGIEVKEGKVDLHRFGIKVE